jgi:hypothetical protein
MSENMARTDQHARRAGTADLRELVADWRLVEELTAQEAATVLMELASLQSAVASRLRIVPTPALTSVTAEQVAERFNRSVAWVYRQAKHWNFTRRVTRRTVRFSEIGLQRFLSQRRTFAP